MVGYDDSALARLAHVDLTTVSQDPPAQAAAAVTAAVAGSTAAPTAHPSWCSPRAW